MIFVIVFNDNSCFLIIQLTVIPIFEPTDEERQQRYYVGFQMPKDATNETVNRLTELFSGGIMLCNSPAVTEQQERDAQPVSSPPPQPASTRPHEQMEHVEEREAECSFPSPAQQYHDRGIDELRAYIDARLSTTERQNQELVNLVERQN